MKTYSYKTVDKLISDYIEQNGDANQINEGCLGSGNWVLSGLYYKFVIKEIFISAWASSHAITKYRKLPQKYQDILENELVFD
jgi:hypothetical protein